MRALNEKFLLKQAMAAYLPRADSRTAQATLSCPRYPSVFSTTPPTYVADLLSTEKLSVMATSTQKVGFLLNKARRGHAIAYKDNMALVGILSTQLCHDYFIERFSRTIRELNTTSCGFAQDQP